MKVSDHLNPNRKTQALVTKMQRKKFFRFVRIVTVSMLLTGTLPASDLPSASAQVYATLAMRVMLAVDAHPRVAAAQATVDAARAQRRAASQPLYNPELGLEFEHAENDTTALGLSQTLDWGDKRTANRRVAALHVRTARTELAQIRQTIGARLVGRLASYQATHDIERNARRRVALMRQFAALAEQRSRAGDLGQVELNLARLALVEARLQLSQSAIRRVSAAQSVAAMAGTAPVFWPSLEPTRIGVPHRDLHAGRYLNRLPQVRAQRMRMAAARALIDVRDRHTRPDPTLSLRGGQEDSSLLAGVSLSMPLYLRNDFRAEVDVANAGLIRAQRLAYHVHRLARARLNGAASRLKLTTQAWRAWRETGSQSLRAQLLLLQQLWQAGELNGAEYLVQTRQALATRARAIELKGQLWRAWAQWLAASGEIGRWLRAVQSSATAG